MNLLIFWLLPLYVAFSARRQNLADAFFSLLCTLFAVYVGLLTFSVVAGLLGTVLPGGLNVFGRPAAMLLTGGAVWFLGHRIVDGVLPNRKFRLNFPERTEKVLAPFFAFLNAGIIIAALFALLTASPFRDRARFLSGNPELCSAARLRLRQAVGVVDLFSGQSGCWWRRRSRLLFELIPVPKSDAKPSPGGGAVGKTNAVAGQEKLSGGKKDSRP